MNTEKKLVVGTTLGILVGLLMICLTEDEETVTEEELLGEAISSMELE